MNTLIVVDDERGFADFVAKVALTAGYRVDVADTAAAFRQMTEDTWPTVLVLDLQMPDTDGIELLREIAVRGCNSKVMLVSGMDGRVLNSAYRLGAELGLGMAGKVTKPVRAPELKRLLEDMRGHNPPIGAEALAAALAGDQLFLLYQPKVDIRARNVVGVEALVRWRTEDGRTIMPDAFIPLAETSGLIDPLTRWVVRTAFRQAADWHRNGLNIHMAVNLSVGNIHDRQLPDELAGLCSSVGIKPEMITLELTETASTKDSGMLLEILGRFRLKGFNLSIDDFGTGYSSVAQLLRLPFSELKIDKSFVSEICHSTEAEIVAKTLIDMAHNLKLKTVAEGVESEGILQALHAWGCDLAQGYYFSKPVDAAAIEHMVTASHFTV
ncbi:MAG: cyclic-di-GMP regulatory protein [Stygiobacter sp.]|nr:MAG: cyclic-di-GMP regulatory protein [Stygiobacter sp.]